MHFFSVPTELPDGRAPNHRPTPQMCCADSVQSPDDETLRAIFVSKETNGDHTVRPDIPHLGMGGGGVRCQFLNLTKISKEFPSHQKKGGNGICCPMSVRHRVTEDASHESPRYSRNNETRSPGRRRIRYSWLLLLLFHTFWTNQTAAKTKNDSHTFPWTLRLDKSLPNHSCSPRERESILTLCTGSQPVGSFKSKHHHRQNGVAKNITEHYDISHCRQVHKTDGFLPEHPAHGKIGCPVYSLTQDCMQHIRLANARFLMVSILSGVHS